MDKAQKRFRRIQILQVLDTLGRLNHSLSEMRAVEKDLANMCRSIALMNC